MIFDPKFGDLAAMNTGQSEITEIYGLLGHFFGLYLTAEGQKAQEIARFVRFR